MVGNRNGNSMSFMTLKLLLLLCLFIFCLVINSDFVDGAETSTPVTIRTTKISRIEEEIKSIKRRINDIRPSEGQGNYTIYLEMIKVLEKINYNIESISNTTEYSPMMKFYEEIDKLGTGTLQRSAYSWLTNVVSIAWKIVKDVVFGGDLSGAVNVVTQSLKTISDNIKTMTSGLENSYNQVASTISTSINDGLSEVNRVKQDIADARNKLTEKLQSEKNKFESTLQDDKNKFTNDLYFRNFDKTLERLKNFNVTTDKSRRPDSGKFARWSLFSGIFDGLVDIVLGIVTPVFKIIIEDIIEPFIKKLFEVMYGLLPIVDYLIELVDKLIEYLICFTIKLVTMLDQKLILFEYLIVFIIFGVTYRNTTSTVIFIVLVVVIFGIRRPYPSILTAILTHTAPDFGNCTYQITKSNS